MKRIQYLKSEDYVAGTVTYYMGRVVNSTLVGINTTFFADWLRRPGHRQLVAGQLRERRRLLLDRVAEESN